MGRRVTPVVGLGTAIAGIALTAAALLYWRGEMSGNLPAWSKSIAAIGLASMLFAYAVLVRNWIGSEGYVLFRISRIDPLTYGEGDADSQVSGCLERVSDLLHRSHAGEEDSAHALEAYTAGLAHGMRSNSGCGPSWLPTNPRFGLRWTRDRLIDARNLGCRHGKAIRQSELRSRR